MILYEKRQIDQWNRIKSPEIHPNIRQLIFDPGAKNTKRRKDSLQ